MFLILVIALASPFFCTANGSTPTTTTISNSPNGPLPAAEKQRGFKEIVNIPKAQLCVNADNESQDNCVNLPQTLSGHFHSADNLSNLSPGKCVYVYYGHTNQNPSDFSTIRCLVTGNYTTRNGIIDSMRLHFFNMVYGGGKQDIQVTGYWGSSQIDDNIMYTPMCNGSQYC